ncbi:MAG: hypothetical protein ABI672_08620 [Vicinamibacteria bacterium]
MARQFLGHRRDLGGTVRTFRADGALEMDEIEGTHGTRRRIFFEDILLVSYHRERSPLFLAVTGGIALFLMGIGVISASGKRDDAIAGYVMMMFGAPFLIAFLLRLFLQVDVITVFGTHGRARMNFEYRKARARQVHQDICREVRSAQARLRPRIPAATAAPSPPSPVPPREATPE